MSAFPPVISQDIGENINVAGIFGRSVDPAKYLIERRRFERPKLSAPGGNEFEWPLGIEGVRISGQIALAEHLYIGDNAAVLQVMHLDNRRIEMRGMFPGTTGAENVRDLLEIIVADTPESGKVLTLPGVFPKNQMVVIESYDFDHAEDERNDSWMYTISFRRQGVSGLVRRKKVIQSPSNPIPKKVKPRGKTTRVFTVRSGARTLRAISSIVFKNNNRWREIYDKNTKTLSKLDTPLHQMPTKQLPLGMKLHY